MMLCRHRYPDGPWNFETRQREDKFWVDIENQNEQLTRERMGQMAGNPPSE